MFPMFTSNVFDQICCWHGLCSITWHLRWLSCHKTTASVALLSNKWYSNLKFLFLSFFLFQISMNVWEVVLIVTKTHGVRTLRAHINASAKKGIMGMEPVVKSETCAHKFAWCSFKQWCSFCSFFLHKSIPCFQIDMFRISAWNLRIYIAVYILTSLIRLVASLSFS